jgi:DNA helicase-2/ATP-dependent DNA helicase PcrA
VQETGIVDDIKKEQTTENLMRWENVQELLNAIAEYTAGDPVNRTLATFLQEVSLITDMDEADDTERKVTLMTLHASKGLEFPVVFITGLEEALFPLAKAAQEMTELEEERRLFYVGVTRAEERLFLSHARSRFRYGQHESSIRSRFLDEIDEDVIRTEAGERHATKPNRFTAGTGDLVRYDEMDPYYYRRNLSAGAASKSATSSASSTSSGRSERRIVYDEGHGEIVPGLRVEHQQFGEGKVLATEGSGSQAKAVVFFQSVGQKKLVLKYARLQVIE